MITDPPIALDEIARLRRIADFVRGFFISLDHGEIRNAILHGAAGGFEKKLSDVDFVVARDTFQSLPGLIANYCARTGWRLCQILRHETTASYFVCSAIDDPACVVALDACSDYQRNGTVFLDAETLLGNRKPLPWGGYGLSPTNELRYRFVKAAVKRKDVGAAALEFAAYQDDIRRECSAWLAQDWNVSVNSWNPDDLTVPQEQLRSNSKSRPSLVQAGTLGRIVSRSLHPTGLVVIAANQDFETTAALLDSVFGHLYFRRFKRARIWNASMIKDLIASTLIIVPNLGGAWLKAIPADCIHRLDPTHNAEAQCRDLARHLHERCAKREKLALPPALT